jgi:hypothetical protein
MVTMAVALVMGSAAAAAEPAQAMRPSREQVTTVPAPVPSGATATTALSAPTQLAPVAGAASLEKAKVRNSGRRVLLLAVALALLALFLIGFTVWFWRATVPTPEALRPLESLRPSRGSKSDS